MKVCKQPWERHIQLEEDTHRYFLRLPSVSTIVKMCFPFETYEDVPEEILEKAILRGNCFHRAMEEYIKNEPEELHCTCEPIVKSHAKLIANGVDLLSQYEGNSDSLLSHLSDLKVEEINSTGYLVGQIDLYGTLAGVYSETPFIIDWKTNKEPALEKWYVQCYLYEHLLSSDDKEYIIINPNINRVFYLHKEIDKVRQIELEELAITNLQQWHIENCGGNTNV